MLVQPHAPATVEADETADPASPAEAAAARLTEEWEERMLALGGRRPRVALAEGGDARVLWAAARLAHRGAVTPVLIGAPERLRALAAEIGLKLPEEQERLDFLDPAEAAADPDITRLLSDARPQCDEAAAEPDPLHLAAAALRLGRVDACLAGSTRPTADVLRAGLRIVGLAPGIRTLSSSFLMVQPDGRLLGYGDCAVVPDPDPEQLSDIARATAATYGTLTDRQPRVAFLSFSTGDSAGHARVDRVREAVALTRTAEPGLAVDGPLQYDAAAVPAIGRAKAPSSRVAGAAEVFVFPGLEAGNIGYKIAQRVGGAVALGPLLQGLAAPLHDLSRGCSGLDIATLATLAALQSTPHARD
jgi:phosphotransacetylase